MNRAALVINMLHILRAHNEYVPLNALAQQLETSVRNIREYKKELETAGYHIETKRGVNGGYYLNQSSLLHAIPLSNREEMALDLAIKLLANRPEYLYYKDFVIACGKFLNNSQKPEAIHTVFQHSTSVKMNKAIGEMVITLQDAVISCHIVELQYASLSSRKTRPIKIHPYDVVNVNGAYYVVGYALEHHEFRSYKVSQERMKKVNQLHQTFVRDSSYKLSQYIGNKSIAKTKEQTVNLKITGDIAIYISENDIGLNTTSHWEDDVLHLTTTFENERACDSFILSLGTDVVIAGPEDVKRRIQDKLMKMVEQM